MIRDLQKAFQRIDLKINRAETKTIAAEEVFILTVTIEQAGNLIYIREARGETATRKSTVCRMDKRWPAYDSLNAAATTGCEKSSRSRTSTKLQEEANAS
ncbi:hypothetical protein L596_029756 [Steinernema carpocapsae]|uniref:Uncharacterized protein n=1 Tax=Steinernema carpocapsae TaxID=34508 RepID=A0A4U5LQR2_STECR|nr:hypothetical protein L596_029756 [Steinernema carpocapsae]